MTRTLLRNCLGCGASVRGKSRCVDCQRDHARAKRARRPDLDDAGERARRRRVVADTGPGSVTGVQGWATTLPTPRPTWWPITWSRSPPEGWRRGRLRVLCRSENCRRSAWLATGLGPLVGATSITPRQPESPTLFAVADDGPSLA